MTKDGDYPDWEYEAESKIKDLSIKTYSDLFGSEPQITALHAGLECGILISKRHSLDCVSIGPEIQDVHPYNEKMSIISVKKNYMVIKRALEKLAKK